jgi:chromosome segregation ATPase
MSTVYQQCGCYSYIPREAYGGYGIDGLRDYREYPREYVKCAYHGGKAEVTWSTWFGINADVERLRWERDCAIKQHQIARQQYEQANTAHNQLMNRFDELLAQAEVAKVAMLESERLATIRAAQQAQEREKQEKIKAKQQHIKQLQQQIKRRKTEAAQHEQENAQAEAELAELSALKDAVQ